MTANSIARLKVTLNDVKPSVQRRVEVPLAIRLDRLHLVLQAAMGGAGQEGSVGEAGGKAAEIPCYGSSRKKGIRRRFECFLGADHGVGIDQQLASNCN